jgi:lipopolysaccharide export system protein LptC
VSALVASWPSRLREGVTTYLPLLLMLTLALSTWWLVKNTPEAVEPRAAVVPRHEPDYTMHNFAVQRFGPDGQLRVRIEGDEARHYPDTDTLEIDNVRIRALGKQGRVTLASARRAITNADASEVQLVGGAEVTSQHGSEEPVRFESEFLHAFLNTEQVKSHLPVKVNRGSSEMVADGMAYDNLSRVVQLKGRVRANLAPPHR